MNERKTLIDLLDNFPVQMEWHDNAELANYLISNGVEIPVRCKDCKFAYINSFSAIYGVALCTHWTNQAAGRQAITKQDAFCSYGERRTGE